MHIPSLTVTALVAVSHLALLAPSSPAQVANDTCETALLIGEGVVFGDNFDAQNDLPATICNTLDGPFVQDVWYRFEPAEKGWLTVTFGCNGADFDTGLFLLGSCSASSHFACNDDYCFVYSQLQLVLQSSQPLLIAVAGFENLGQEGEFALKVTVDRVSQHIVTLTKIWEGVGGFDGPIQASDDFGVVGALGDLDGNGVIDVAVGAPADDTGGVSNSGSVWILRHSAEGTVLSQSKLDNEHGLDFSLPAGALFGSSVAGLGDVDADGVPDLAVGSPLDDGFGGPPDTGAIRILRLRPNGLIKSFQKVTEGFGFSGALDQGDRFGSGLAAIGDVDGNGVPDIAVGSDGDDSGAIDAGAVWILLLNPGGTVVDQQMLSAEFGGFTGTLEAGDRFGAGVGAPGDIDGDGVPDLVVGAPFGGAAGQGAFWTVLLNSDGTAKAATQIDMPPGLLPTFGATSCEYGAALCGLGDINGDGVPDLAVGAPSTGHGPLSGDARGVVFLVSLNADGSAQEQTLLTDPFKGSYFFGEPIGRSLASAGDVDGDGHGDLLVGDAGPSPTNAYMTLFLDPDNAWTTLTEGGIAGENSYAPELRGEGPLTPGSPWNLELAIAKPFSPVNFVVGFIALFAPFKGGVLVPAPDLVIGGFQTNGQGRLELQGAWPGGIPADVELWIQAWVMDGGAPVGLAASNAVRATTP